MLTHNCIIVTIYPVPVLYLLSTSCLHTTVCIQVFINPVTALYFLSPYAYPQLYISHYLLCACIVLCLHYNYHPPHAYPQLYNTYYLLYACIIIINYLMLIHNCKIVTIYSVPVLYLLSTSCLHTTVCIKGTINHVPALYFLSHYAYPQLYYSYCLPYAFSIIIIHIMPTI